MTKTINVTDDIYLELEKSDGDEPAKVYIVSRSMIEAGDPEHLGNVAVSLSNVRLLARKLRIAAALLAGIEMSNES